ncbi:VRR-NUC domain-containing protein [Sediminitomix flava]|uniref:phosphodiesterase I n=1 Tax=Sediminitomix flava TaxID=379075 RepID=A0A315Z7M9_SEDFL|nr:VRR-NUC domain-containing protein [Sediminitomix flava]PWJ39210.1 VRR-NUC domain-containing protein [Sediminitomix flava]
MEKSQSNQQLEEGYYLLNFLKLIDFVCVQYDDLLSEEEKLFVEQFRSLSQDAQRLYVRLLSRKGPYFLSSKLQYKEVLSIENAITELIDDDFAKSNDRENAVVALYTLTKSELVDWLSVQSFPFPSSFTKAKKQTIISYLLEMENDSLWDAIDSSMNFISLEKLTYVQLFRLLFFGNLEQELHEFILEDLGVLKYENYPIRKEDRFFQTREVIEASFLMTNLKTELWLAQDAKDVDRVLELGEILLSYPFPERLTKRRAKACNQIGRFLETFKLWDQALFFYQQTEQSPSRERQSRVLDKVGEFEQALSICNEIMKNPKDDEEAEFAQMFGEKLKKKLELPFEKAKRVNYPTENLILKKIEVRVEQSVLQYYQTLGYDGFYTENLIWSALFGLAFWDIIFQPVPAVFFHAYQRGPVDLFQTEFREKREVEIAARLRELEEGQFLRKLVLERWDEKYLTANWLVSWKKVEKYQLETILDWLSSKQLVLLFDQMSKSLSDFRSGFPDLFIFHPKEDKYALVEVKGPGDQLRSNQRRWLRFFANHQIPHFVAKVKWDE